MDTLLRLVGWPPAEADDEAAFWREQAALGARHLKLLLLFGGTIAVAWLPTDAIFFRELSQARAAFVWARGAGSALCLGTLLLVTGVSAARRHAVPIIMLVGALLCFTTARALSLAGGPEQPWFHFTYMFVMVPFTIALRPLHRVLLTALYAASLLAGYFVAGPWSLRSPLGGAAASFLVFASALSIIAGLLADGLRRRALFARLDAQRQARALADLSASLEAQVLARTDELQRALQAVEAAREEERTRIARDLHDELGQELTALGYAVDLTIMREANGKQVGANLREIKAQMARLRSVTRALLVGLRPMVLEDLGLEAALEWLVSRTRERPGTECRLQLSLAGAEVPPQVASVAFRVVQEALTNAAKHAGARSIEVDVRCEGGSLSISVRDDGSGFDAASAPQGLGLLGMRERVRALGGTLQVQGAPGEGTVISAALPLVAFLPKAA